MDGISVGPILIAILTIGTVWWLVRALWGGTRGRGRALEVDPEELVIDAGSELEIAVPPAQEDEAEVPAPAAPVESPVLAWPANTQAEPVRRDQPLGQAPGDLVDCTVFSSPTVAAGDTFLVQVVAHLQEQAELARKLATEFDAHAERRGFTTLEMEIERGTSISFGLALAGLEIDGPLQTLVWRGTPQAVQFGVTVPASMTPRTVIGTVTVWLATTPVGHVKFRLDVVKQGATEPSAPASPMGESARFYRQAFISYASKDRTEVLKRVQLLSKVHIPFFQDVLSLEPGDRWEQALYRHIDDSDLFLLFWSTSAKRSKWVLKEVRYAIERKGGDDHAPPEIVPVPIEGPPPVLPPKDLQYIHFNDPLLYFMR